MLSVIPSSGSESSISLNIIHAVWCIQMPVIAEPKSQFAHVSGCVWKHLAFLKPHTKATNLPMSHALGPRTWPIRSKRTASATTRQSARARHAAKWSSPCRSWRRCDLAGDSDLMALLCIRVGTIILVWGRFLWFGFAVFIWAIDIYRVPRSKLASYIPICRDGHTVLPSWTRN